ncbi:MAG: hypothetical protein ACRDF0_02210 [Candidatus Limnocylindria bacterium]
MVINRDAQLLVLDRALPLLRPGASVVHVTSHWAHLYGRVAQLPEYEPVARSKHAGELALRAREEELRRRGIRLLVVTGDLVEGTITARLLERAAMGLAEQRPVVLPSPARMAKAIVDASLDRSLPSGHTVAVGASLPSLGPR